MMRIRIEKWNRRAIAWLTLLIFCRLGGQPGELPGPGSQKQLPALMKLIQGEMLMDIVRELSSPKYQGRLTGTPGYDAAARWVADRLAQWKIVPAGDEYGYFQKYPNAYTEVLPGAELILDEGKKEGTPGKKSYQYETDFYPGATSDSGTVTAEVVYVGYGITAPELNFDDYQGMDVRGKIVLIESESPVDPSRDPERFKQWRQYSFHQYKTNNAFAHGALAILMNYLLVNPNNLYQEGLLIANVGKTVVNDLFRGYGRNHKKIQKKIKSRLKPMSFATGKTMTLTCVTRHHPDGVGLNVIGMFPGSDPRLQNQPLILGAHLDHVGMAPRLMPGANDNASGVAVLLEVARVLNQSPVPLKRPVLFLFLGSEEAGLTGVQHYLEHPNVALKNILAFINVDGAGRGRKISIARNPNNLLVRKCLARMNSEYIHARFELWDFPNLARPRLDAAYFDWAGVPSVSLSASGGKSAPVPTYHTSHDQCQYLTPPILTAISRLIFLSAVELCR